MTVVPAVIEGTNVDLIHAVVRLGHIRPDDRVIDLTYGRGAWWRKGAPDDLTTLTPPADFRATGYPDDHFDVVCFDGPYRLNGTPDLGDFDARYGIDVPMSWPAKHQLLRDGIDEGLRILRGREGRRLGGRLLVKCQDQVCSGAKRWQAREFADYAERGLLLDDLDDARTLALDAAALAEEGGGYYSGADVAQLLRDLVVGWPAPRARLVDMLLLKRPVRSQPAGRRQVHSRGNYSTLLILEKF